MNVFAHIGIGIFVGLIAVFVNDYIIPVPLWFWGIVVIALLGCFQYFTPLEEVEASELRFDEQDKSKE